MKVDEDEKEYDLFRQLALKRVAEEEENSESSDHKPFVEVEDELFLVVAPSPVSSTHLKIVQGKNR